MNKDSLTNNELCEMPFATNPPQNLSKTCKKRKHVIKL